MKAKRYWLLRRLILKLDECEHDFKGIIDSFPIGEPEKAYWNEQLINFRIAKNALERNGQFSLETRKEHNEQVFSKH